MYDSHGRGSAGRTKCPQLLVCSTTPHVFFLFCLCESAAGKSVQLLSASDEGLCVCVCVRVIKGQESVLFVVGV